jgi:hypothetical protein
MSHVVNMSFSCRSAWQLSLNLLYLNCITCMQYHRRQEKWRPTVAATALLTQYAILLISLPKERAHWNEVEINKLVDFLHGK